MKSVVRGLCPPIIWNGLRSLRQNSVQSQPHGLSPDHQDLDVYWNPEMAAMLETWGEDNVWQEIQLLMCSSEGKVLDIACGTGKTIEVLSCYPKLEIHGCDISDFLLQKAVERGIPEARLHVTDATKMKYVDNEFKYSYSIGSLEHFTEDGIPQFLSESRRVSSVAAYHQIPTSRSGKNEGWVKTFQAYHNNSVEWWLERFKSVFETVYVVGSAWNDEISVGKWFICSRNESL
ncbi:MAG: hypothetical protein QOH96_2953 [Blastocatellia bacterium]|jgi:ubiquinone/menaquinone biosynthesis C-methylase UbiE|nr:hypothetical protein [Blastocatellia bacterium]